LRNNRLIKVLGIESIRSPFSPSSPSPIPARWAAASTSFIAAARSGEPVSVASMTATISELIAEVIAFVDLVVTLNH
jgi:hypothetical protein